MKRLFVLSLLPLTMAACRNTAVPEDLEPAPPTENELVIYSFPANATIRYDSPRALMSSFVAATVDFTGKSAVKHVIGHTFIRLRAGGKEILTGQTTDGAWEEGDVVRKHGYGLGYLGTAFVGRLDKAEKLEEELADRFETGEMSYIRFLLSPTTAARMMKYLEDYERNGYSGWWGEANRPRYGEGGACASFAVSFLDVGGIMRPEYSDAWTVSFRIPKELYGGPLFGQEVTIAKTVADNVLTSRWAKEDEQHVLCLMWDPSKIHGWTRRSWEEERASRTGTYSLEQTGQARGLVVDCRSTPIPEESIWLDPLTSPNIHGRQPGSRTSSERPEAAKAMGEDMRRQRARMRELGMIDR